MRTQSKRIAARIALFGLTAGVVVAVGASPAFGVAGSAQFLVKGPGSVYGYEQGSVYSLLKAPATAAVFSVQVKNTGNSTGQFLLSAAQTDAQPFELPGVKFKATASNLDITYPVLNGGWATDALKPGAAQTLIFSITLPKLTPANLGEEVLYTLTLADINGNEINFENLDTRASSTVVRGGANAFLTTPSQQTAALQREGDSEAVTISEGVPVKPGAKVVYTLKLENNESAPTSLTVRAADIGDVFCNNDAPPQTWSTVIKAGTVDVTSLVTNIDAGYVTPVLKPKATVSLTFTLAPLATFPDGCTADAAALDVRDGFGDDLFGYLVSYRAAP